jgi:hypothetical protein
MASPDPVDNAHRIELRRDSIRKSGGPNQNAAPLPECIFTAERGHEPEWFWESVIRRAYRCEAPKGPITQIK